MADIGREFSVRAGSLLGLNGAARTAVVEVDASNRLEVPTRNVVAVREEPTPEIEFGIEPWPFRREFQESQPALVDQLSE